MRSLPPSVLALVLALSTPVSAHADPPARALSPLAWGADVGLLSTGLAAADGAWADTFAAQSLGGHVLFGGLTLEGGLLALQPLTPGGAGLSLTLGARVGYTGEHWSLVGGPLLGFAPGARPRLQVLPSLRALRHVGPVTLHAGFLDAQGLVPAHLGVSWKNVGLAYVLPLGARVWGRLPLSQDVALRVDGFAFRLAGIDSRAFTFGLDVTP